MTRLRTKQRLSELAIGDAIIVRGFRQRVTAACEAMDGFRFSVAKNAPRAWLVTCIERPRQEQTP